MKTIKTLADIELFAIDLFEKIGNSFPNNLEFIVKLNEEDFDEIVKRCFAENDMILFFSTNLSIKLKYAKVKELKEIIIEASSFNFIVKKI